MHGESTIPIVVDHLYRLNSFSLVPQGWNIDGTEYVFLSVLFVQEYSEFVQLGEEIWFNGLKSFLLRNQNS